MIKETKIIAGFFVAVLGMVTSLANAAIWVDPNIFDVNITEGCSTTKTLTIGNDGLEDLNFTLRSRETSREILSGLSAGRTTVAAVEAPKENKMVLEYEFSKPVVSKSAEYDLVQIEALEQYLRTGAPIVPVRPVTVLVPFGKKVAATQVIPVNVQELPGTYRLPPAQKPYPLSYQGTVERTRPDPAIYGRTTPWPGMQREEVATQSKRGYQLFTVNLFPLQYTPSTGKISYTTRLRLEIYLADSGRPNLLRPSQKTTSSLSRMVDNPSALRAYPAKGKSVQKFEAAALPGGGPYQYVIITNETLEAAPGPWNFQALRDAKIAHGITATIVTTDWIYANYDGTRPDGGSDNQTRIRNFLIEAYQDWGTEYVLLGGTNGIVPARMFRVDGANMPVDMYYGCVDPVECTFDYDADGQYGEPTDGVGGSDVDLYAEIYVGRAAVENATELTNFIKKTLAYSSTYSEYLPLITMLGEYLGFGGVAEYAKPAMEQVRLGGDYDGYFTYGFENHPQLDFCDFDTSTNLYDADGTWPKNNLINLMNAGTHLFNHLGHAWYDYDMKLYNSDLSSLTNTDYFFAYSQGCNPGGFDITDCFAEVITSMEHGAFAVVMNARSGWGRFNSTDGPSQRFARQFWDAVLGQDILELGRANQDSKEDNLWDINGSRIRWCYYELNLFGDPQQRFRFEEACEWLTTEPEEGTIGPAESNDISVTFDAITMAPGTYEAEIIIVSNDPCSPNVIPVTMTVNPDDLVVTPTEDFASSGTKGGPFTPQCMTYTLTNNGTADVSWTTMETEDWLGVDPNAGVLSPTESIQVSVCITPDADLLDPNIYTDTVIFQNTDSGSIKPRSATLTVKPPDCFTESFDANDRDLEYLSLTFSPDGSIAYYIACREEVDEFPTEPNGGTYISLGDDDFVEVVLGHPKKKVLFYGQRYNRLYIGSNGYITFRDGDTQFTPSLENHFSMPRISAMFTDLTPADSQSISCKELGDRVVVTFEDVPLYGDKTAKSSFQVEMFFADGTICITWLNLAATDSIAGLSEGKDLPVLFAESDLSRYIPCHPWCDLNTDYTVNFVDIAVLAAHWLDTDCNIPYWCGKTDLDFSGLVDMPDVALCSDNWLIVEDWWLQPVSHWKFDEGEGDIAYDSAGNNDGNIYGATWATGQIDYALNFDGYGDYVQVSSVSGFKSIDEPGSNVTIAAWVKKPAQDSLWDTIVSTEAFRFQIQESRAIRWGWTNGTSHDESQSSGSITLNEWYHIAVTKQGDNITFYINGNIDSSDLNAGFTRTTSSLRIGKDGLSGIGGSDYFDGIVDDVWIYDRTLSAEEIWQLYQDGLGYKAFNPSPANGSTGVDPDVVLSWSPGKDALSHDVYLGTGYSDVNDATPDSAEYMGNQDANSYDPNGLDPETTYYWRIDEVDASNTYKGNVWSFTTWVKPNLVGWWKFDEGEGDIAYDSAGNNDGTIYGATWTTGQIDGALSFDGTGDYVEVDDTSELEGMDDLTVSAWIKPQQNSGQDNVIIVDKDYATAYRFHIYDADQADGKGILVAWINGIDAPPPNDIEIEMSGNTWYQVVLVYSNGDNELRYYVNGSLAETRTVISDAIGTNGYPLRIGRSNHPDLLQYFKGTIDDVRFYDRTLSAEEIWQLYQDGLSYKAFNPSPVDGSTGVDPDVVLSWSPGKDALSHDVYLGTGYNDVNDATPDSAEYMGNQDADSYDPNGLDLETTYYWRIDEVDASNTYKGNVWSFMTWVEPNLVGWWKFDEGSGTTASDSSGNGNDGTLNGDPSWAAGKVGSYALDFDGDGDHVEIADDDSLTPSSRITIAFWIYNRGGQTAGIYKYASCPGGSGSPGDSRAYNIQIIDSTGKLFLRIFSSVSNYDDIYSNNTVPLNQWHHVAGTFNQGEAVVYIDGQLDNSGTLSVSSIMNDAQPLIIGGHWDYCGEDSFQSRLNGKADDVRIYDKALSAEEIWQLYQDGLGYKAFNPNPADGAMGVDPNTVLRWSPGKDALSHDVYLGTGYSDVNDATPDSAEYMGNQDTDSYDPNGLDLETTYYWRIDEVGASNTYKGNVWSFTTWVEPNLVGWWEFDEGSGITASDSSGNGNDGTLNGDPSWVGGKVGSYALDFDGYGDYVQVSSVSGFKSIDEPGSNVTIAVWVKKPAQDSLWDTIVSTEAFRFQIEQNRLIRWGWTNGTSHDESQSSGSITLNEWYHVAVTKQGDNITFYINGNIDSSDLNAGLTRTISSLRIGKDGLSGIGGSDYFDGIIDDVRIYDRALSAGEIWQLYQDGLN